MAGLWWITVMMVFSLSAARIAEIDLNRLAGLAKQIMTNIRDGYKIEEMYAVAASIPKDENQNVSYDLTKVKLDPQTKWNDGILSFSRLVVAKIKRVTPKKGDPYTEHAEWRVLHNLQLFSNPGDLLVFFSHASPCYERCANPGGNLGITGELKTLFSRFARGAKAFVFNTLFRPHGGNINSNTISAALTNIKEAIGRHNIFRCYKPDNHYFHCIKCFNGNQTDPHPNCTS